MIFSVHAESNNTITQEGTVFNDVVKEHPYVDAVSYLRAQGVIQGYADGTFMPDQTINRAEFLKIVMGTLDPKAQGENCFSDVKEEWFAKYVCSAKAKGIISGYEDGSFKPDRNIFFVEASKIVSKAFALSTSAGSGQWYTPFVKALEKKKAIPVSIDYMEKSVTRSEMAEMVYRLKAGKVTKASKSFAALSSKFPQISSCDELQEKLKTEDYRQNYRYGRVMYSMEEAAPSNASTSFEKSVSAGSEDSASSYSQTNTQVEGVDESDIIKNDGKYIYMVEGKTARIFEAYPPESLTAFDPLSFPDPQFTPQELYISDGKLVIIGTTYFRESNQSSEKIAPWGFAPYQSRTKIYVYDVANPSTPSLVRESEFDGNFVSSRRIKNHVYLVTSVYPSYYILKDHPIEDVIPQYKDSLTGVSGQVATCSDISYFPRYQSPSFLVVAGIPLDSTEGSTIEREVYMGASANTVYSSLENLYVSLPEYNYDENVRYDMFAPSVMEASTSIYQFKLVDGKIRFSGRGQVSGTVLNQFSMDENGDDFRIATTTREGWSMRGNTLKNHLFILDRNNLETIRGKIENIAPGEQIYSVRFVGNRAYMVTFKNTDPFFVIDVSDGAQPKILGKLKIPGFSDYLHPYDENHIIGFGKEAVDSLSTTEGVEFETTIQESNFAWYQGMKMAVFDVTDVSNPKEMFKEVIGDRGTTSELLYNHKALLFDKAKGLLAFPLTVAEIKDKTSHTGSEYGIPTFVGAYVYKLDLTDGFTLRGKITHFDASYNYRYASYNYPFQKVIGRVLYLGDYLYTVSHGMIKANRLNDLGQVSALQWEVVDDPWIGYPGIDSTSIDSTSAIMTTDTNNTLRNNDVKALLDAISEYSIDNSGALPSSIPSTENGQVAAVIGNDASKGQADFCSELVPTYIAAMPFDPTAEGAHYTDCSDYNTGYTVISIDNRVTIAAPSADSGETINVTR
ncbi:beta-propeller domain-containing protein [Candidatus Peregrinibacteria bacterium]|nr:beta-propeller domain-containing protein [Candidatus Peregrinibacteria bacterium]